MKIFVEGIKDLDINPKDMANQEKKFTRVMLTVTNFVRQNYPRPRRM